MKPGELQRQLTWLGLTHGQAAHALGLSRDHVRALCSGRDSITDRVAKDVMVLSLDDAAATRLELWERNDFVPQRAKRMARR